MMLLFVDNILIIFMHLLFVLDLLLLLCSLYRVYDEEDPFVYFFQFDLIG